jgi:glycosyltransferase involved in cell wall biosynthesis
MLRPLFSIVTVTLNPGERLLATTESLSRQTFADWEHIVKDGGSTDGSPKGLPVDSRRRVLVKSDQGIFDAMNQALDVCCGQFVLFLNAGDCFFKDDVLAAVAETIRSSEAPIIITHIFYQDSNRIRPYPNKLTRSYLIRQIPCQQALYITLDAYRKYGGFSLDYPCLADPELLLRFVLQRGLAVASCPKPGVVFEGGGFSSTEKFRKQAILERTRLLNLYFTPLERFKFTVRRVILLQSIRERINRHFPNGPVAKINHWVTSQLNLRH